MPLLSVVSQWRRWECQVMIARRKENVKVIVPLMATYLRIVSKCHWWLFNTCCIHMDKAKFFVIIVLFTCDHE
jgi:hypothetical protein